LVHKGLRNLPGQYVNSDNIICIELPGLNPLSCLAQINKAGGFNITPDRQEDKNKRSTDSLLYADPFPCFLSYMVCDMKNYRDF
jgi:hypothetical protein